MNNTIRQGIVKCSKSGYGYLEQNNEHDESFTENKRMRKTRPCLPPIIFVALLDPEPIAESEGCRETKGMDGLYGPWWREEKDFNKQSKSWDGMESDICRIYHGFYKSHDE